MALLNGIFNTSQNPAELNMRSFAATLLRRFPNGTAPLFALSSQSGKSKAVSSTHGYLSKTMAFIATTATAAATNVATTITVGSNVGMTVNMVLHNLRTRENMLVTAIPAGTTTVTVQRAYGRVAAAAMNIADGLIQVGTSFAEGSSRPVARQLSVTYVANFTQIFRNAWGLTGTARASLAEKGYSNVAESRTDCATFHSTDIESAIIWGQASMTTTGASPVHSTQGIMDAMAQYSPSNLQTAGATTTYKQFVSMLMPAFAFSSDMSNSRTRVIFGDNQAIQVINDIGRASGQVFISQDANSFGMNFTTFRFHQGELKIMNHPLLNGLGVAGTALIMDMPALKLAYMDGRDTQAEEYVLEVGNDGIGGSLLSELAVELVNPYSCGMIEGLTSGIA